MCSGVTKSPSEYPYIRLIRGAVGVFEAMYHYCSLGSMQTEYRLFFGVEFRVQAFGDRVC